MKAANQLTRGGDRVLDCPGGVCIDAQGNHRVLKHGKGRSLFRLLQEKTQAWVLMKKMNLFLTVLQVGKSKITMSGEGQLPTRLSSCCVVVWWEAGGDPPSCSRFPGQELLLCCRGPWPSQDN